MARPWSPWYVGNSMTNLDEKFGVDRIIDTPVSESVRTGAAVGVPSRYAANCCTPQNGLYAYAMDAIVNQAAKWSHMLGGQAHPAVTVRSTLTGGEQGAQHLLYMLGLHMFQVFEL